MKFDVSKYAPCDAGVEYYNSKQNFETAWDECPRGDWMLWLAGKLKVDEKLIVKAAALCAKTVEHLMEHASKAAVQAALDYSDGKISKEELRKFRNAADDYVTLYCVNPADAADAAAYAAAYAAGATYIAAAAADAAARSKNQAAQICRDVLTASVLSKIGEQK